MGSPVITNNRRRWIIGIVCHIYGEGLSALVAPFRRIEFWDSHFNIERPETESN